MAATPRCCCTSARRPRRTISQLIASRSPRKRTSPVRRDQEAPRRVSPGWYSTSLAQIKGVTEETTTGVNRLYQMQEGHLKFPAINVNDSRHQVEVRQPLRLPRIAGRRHQARHRRDDRRQGRGRRGLRRRRQGLGAGLAAPLSAQVIITEIDPICALQAAMEGYRVVTMDYAADKADIFVTATGNFHVITHEHMAKMKDRRSSATSATSTTRSTSRRSSSTSGTTSSRRSTRRLPGRQAHHPAGRRAGW
jgi:hypothetical protein